MWETSKGGSIGDIGCFSFFPTKNLGAAGDGDFLLYYHGQIDDSRLGNNIPLSGKDLRSAVKDLNQDNSYPSNQMPSLGCNIKWTPGKEPSWFK